MVILQSFPLTKCSEFAPFVPGLRGDIVVVRAVMHHPVMLCEDIVHFVDYMRRDSSSLVIGIQFFLNTLTTLTYLLM